METDAQDLAALIEETCDAPVLIAAMGDGANRAVHVAADRPELVQAVVCVSGNPVSRTAGQGGEGLAASDSVIEALLSMMETDYRGALRTMISTANPDLGRGRGAHARQRERRAVSRRRRPRRACGRGSRTRRSSARARWATACGSSRTERTRGSWRRRKRTAELLPEAHVHAVENGAVSRPDIAASYISAITGVGDPAAVRGGVAVE